MKKLFLILIAVVLCGICNAQVSRSRSDAPLSASESQYVLESFCRSYYSRCFEGKAYVPGTLYVKSVGIDQNTGGTYVSGIHTYQGQYIPFRGRKTHNDVQFNAIINRQDNGDYVIFHKWYEPDWLNPKGAWETGQGLVQYRR